MVYFKDVQISATFREYFGLKNHKHPIHIAEVLLYKNYVNIHINFDNYLILKSD